MRNLITILICLLLAVPCAADIITVDDDGPTDFNNIQAAIVDANDGDTIDVKPGTYTGPGNYNIDFKGKAITVRSENGPENCIIDIDCQRYDGFLFFHDEDENSVLDGFTITGGRNGIVCVNARPKIMNCLINHNSDNGISVWLGGPKIFGCRITSNSAVSGAGISIWASCNMTKISNCLIANNSASGGGGIFCDWAKITNCTIVENSAQFGGGILIFSDAPGPVTITNTIVWSNVAYYEYPQIFPFFGDVVVRYCCVQGGWEGQDNIDMDPCFVEAGYWADANDTNIIVEPNDPNAVWMEGDYHLWKDSPCIDAGDPNYVAEPNETDLDGNPRVIDGRIDMGAYEFISPIQAEMKITPNMLNCKSKGNWVKAQFVLLEGFAPEDVDVEEPALAELPQATIDSEYIKLLDKDDGLVRLEIGFDRQVFCELLTDDSIVSDNNPVEITVVGYLTTSQYFYGSDSIRIKH